MGRSRSLEFVLLLARADLIQLQAPDYAYVAYRPGVDVVRRVFLNGDMVVEKARDVR